MAQPDKTQLGWIERTWREPSGPTSETGWPEYLWRHNIVPIIIGAGVCYWLFARA